MVFIVIPITFMVILSFIFQAGLQNINVQQLRLNCPFPINAGIALIQDIDSNNNLNYTVIWDNSTSDYHQTVFKCGEGNTVNAFTVVYTTANNWFNIGTGYLFYFSNVITTLVDKIVALGTMLYLLVNAPAEVTGLSFFSYVNIVFIAFIILGGFMIIRGS